jgi:hypothetical protein
MGNCRKAFVLTAVALLCNSDTDVTLMLQIQLHRFDALAAHALGCCCLVAAPCAAATSTRCSTRLLDRL